MLEVLHITCNMCTRDLPDMYALGPRAYISGKSLVPMLQLLLIAGIYLSHSYINYIDLIVHGLAILFVFTPL